MKELKISDLDQNYLKNFIKTKVPQDVVDDILQDVNLAVISKLNSENLIKDINAFSFQVARNKIADYYKKMQRLIDVENQFASVVNQDLEPCVCDILEIIIDKLLPEEYSKPFILSDIHRMPQKEIGDKLGLNYENTKSRIQRARKMFKEEAQKFGEIKYNNNGQFLSFKLNKYNDIDPELASMLQNLKLIE